MIVPLLLGGCAEAASSPRAGSYATEGARQVHATQVSYATEVARQIQATRTAQQTGATAPTSTAAPVVPTATAVLATPTPDATKATRDKVVQDHLGAANSFVAAKNWPAALKEYDAALAVDPENQQVKAARAQAQAQGVTAHLGAANSFEQAKNWPAALRELNAALVLDPESQPVKKAKDDIVSPCRAYATQAEPILADLGDRWTQFVQENEELRSNPFRNSDAAWDVSTGFNPIGMKSDSDQLASLRAPPPMSHIQLLFATEKQEMYLMVDQFARGADNFDAQLIRSAVGHTQNITTLETQATAEIKNLESQF